MKKRTMNNCAANDYAMEKRVKKTSVYLALIICMLLSAACWALVNPQTTMLRFPGWSAEIFVAGPNGTYFPYCKGSLIASNWVLSSAACYFDPFKAKDAAANPGDPAFVIRLGNSDTWLEVADHIDNDDFTLTLWRLAEAVSSTPIKLSARTSAELIHANVLIPGNQSTPAVRHSFFNPSQGENLVCNMDGVVFFTDDALCYLLGDITTSATLLSSSAVIVDPSRADAPDTALDRAIEIDASGARLYLDFRGSNSYPCNEDLGAAVVWQNADGGYELVAVAAGIGMSIGLPVCTPALVNEFRSVAHYRAFIDETIVDYEFSALCPAAPEPLLRYTGANGINISWPAVPGATGYKIHYTDLIGYFPIETVDLKTGTEVATNLDENRVYTASLTAYNETCSSSPSELLTISF
jgi:hypothetical protein